MLIRRMGQDDLPQVAEIERQTFAQPWSESGFEDSLALNCTIFLVAEEAGSILGYIGMYTSLDEGEITNVAVEETSRGKGVGAKLVAAIQQEAKEFGICRIVLEVRVSNQPAIHVYQKAGFRIIGTRKGFYEMPREDAYICVWEITESWKKEC